MEFFRFTVVAIEAILPKVGSQILANHGSRETKLHMIAHALC
jgi:hypothetical protein